VSNSELDTVANLPKSRDWRPVRRPNLLGMGPINSLLSTATVEEINCKTEIPNFLLCPTPNWMYGGKLTKPKSFEVRQTTQLGRDGSCQLISPYKTIEEISCKTEIATMLLCPTPNWIWWQTYQNQEIGGPSENPTRLEAGHANCC
jgi:hypothetical protein